ncbi:MAG: homocysteine S-methyltransferase family protein, partial [Gemmatimonadales bacterium]
MSARAGAESASPGTTAPTRAGSVDLHSHSTASDGASPPEGVVETAARAGLTAIALTDHDTLAGVAAARLSGTRLGVRVVAGVELSLMDGEREVHVLGLHIAQVDALERELAAVRLSRRARAERIVEKLNALGIPITSGAVFAESGDGAVGRPHVARALIAGGSDLLLVETIFDSLNAKAALVAIREVFDQDNAKLPVMISAAVGRGGETLISAQTTEAFWNAVKHVKPLSVGLNCSLGPDLMYPF